MGFSNDMRREINLELILYRSRSFAALLNVDKVVSAFASRIRFIFLIVVGYSIDVQTSS